MRGAIATPFLVALLLLTGAGFAGGRWLAAPANAGTPHDANVAPAAYADLLAQHVKRVARRDGGFESRFDYAALVAREDQVAVRAALREAFQSVEPAALDRDARYAWAINAYNFFVIDAVVEALAGTPDLASVAEIGAGNFAVFDEPRIALGEERLSLNAFERRYLFLDVDRSAGKIPEGLDPRLHFAIVCAAKGCPPLFPQPYTAKNLSAQLDMATQNALAGPGHLRLGEEVARLSQIFSWYAADFGGEGGMLVFLADHVPAVAQMAEEGRAPAMRADIEWDWSLNRP